MGSTPLSQLEIWVNQKRTLICQFKPTTTYLRIKVQFNSWHSSFVHQGNFFIHSIHSMPQHRSSLEMSFLYTASWRVLTRACAIFCHNSSIMCFVSRQFQVSCRIRCFWQFWVTLAASCPSTSGSEGVNLWDMGPSYLPLRKQYVQQRRLGTRKVSHRKKKSRILVSHELPPPPLLPPTGPVWEIYDPHNYGVLLNVNKLPPSSYFHHDLFPFYRQAWRCFGLIKRFSQTSFQGSWERWVVSW